MSLNIHHGFDTEGFLENFDVKKMKEAMGNLSDTIDVASSLVECIDRYRGRVRMLEEKNAALEEANSKLRAKLNARLGL